MKNAFRALLVIACACLCLPAGAACPVGKRVGDTWCANGMVWRCDRCGSEYCSIFTGRRCVRDDAAEPAARPAFRHFLQGRSDEAVLVPLRSVAAEPADRAAHGS